MFVALVLRPSRDEWLRKEFLLLLLLIWRNHQEGLLGGSHPSEIPVGEPIIPPYNGSKVLPVARLQQASKTAGVSPYAEEAEESSDSLLEEIAASPPRFESYHGEQLEDDPQLTAGNMKKFQAAVREFTRFSVVSTIVEYFFLVWDFPLG